MNAIHLLNAGALGLALLLGAVAVAHITPPAAPALPVAASVADIRGIPVPIQPYQRIISLSLVADSVLATVAEPGQIVAVSAYNTGDLARRWADRRRLTGLDDLEAIIQLRPDLVFVNTAGGEHDRLARLQAAGVRVFALGAMEGLATYQRDARMIAAVLGKPAIGERLARTLADRLARVAALLPAGTPRPRALFLSSFGDALFGGTTGTSSHDVLIAAGCRDAAADQFHGWPQFSVEQILVLAPDIIVTRHGQAAALARRAGLERLPARWIEIDGDLLEDPGPGMLDVAEAIYAQVHGNPLPVPAAPDPSQP